MSIPPLDPNSVGGFGTDTLELAVVAMLLEQLDAWSVPAGLGRCRSWDAVPSQDALESASLPAGAVTVPGLVEDPVRKADHYEGVYRLAVGVYCRGANYTDTKRRAGRWSACLRSCVQANRGLGLPPGTVRSVTLRTEVSTVGGRNTASRTLGGCAVQWDVAIPDLMDLLVRPPVDANTPAPGDPVVKSLPTTTTALPPNAKINTGE